MGIGIAIGALNGFFYGIHRPSVPLVAMIADNVANVVLCYGLVFGVFGLPALRVCWGGLGVCPVVYRPVCHLTWGRFSRRRVTPSLRPAVLWQLSWSRFRQFVRIGWPAGVQQALDVLSWGVLIILMVGRFGREQLAASNIAIQYTTIAFLPGIGLGQALTALVGKYIGEKKPDMAVQRVYEGLFLAMTYMTFVGLLYFLFPAPLLSVFTSDPEVIRAGSTIFLCVAFFQLFDAMNVTFAGALRGAGDTHGVAWITVALLVTVFAPLSLSAVAYTNLESLGPWLAGTIYTVFLGLSLWRRFARGKWQGIDIFATGSGKASEELRVKSEELPVVNS